MNNLYYTFQSTGSTNPNDNFKLFLDSKGNIIANNNLEYGVYNKIISINIQKFLFVKVKKIGFGDIIDFITRKTGLKIFIAYITNGNCGCEERRIKFNKFRIPYMLSIHTRQLYDVDYQMIEKNKNLLFKNLETKEIKEKIISTTPKKSHKTIQSKPLTQDQIKKSCGCGRKP